MGLKCSLFGHDYADYDVERERTEHGAEVVTTVRTVETCRRCGHTRVVAENTEIAANVAGSSASSAAGTETPSDGEGKNSDESSHATDSAARSDRSSREGDRPVESGVSPSDTGTGTDGGEFGPTAAVATSRSLADSELWCPACDFAEPLLGSALRAGDSCPECTRGYLTRRTRKG